MINSHEKNDEDSCFCFGLWRAKFIDSFFQIQKFHNQFSPEYFFYNLQLFSKQLSFTPITVQLFWIATNCVKKLAIIFFTGTKTNRHLSSRFLQLLEKLLKFCNRFCRKYHFSSLAIFWSANFTAKSAARNVDPRIFNLFLFLFIKDKPYAWCRVHLFHYLMAFSLDCFCLQIQPGFVVEKV